MIGGLFGVHFSSKERHHIYRKVGDTILSSVIFCMDYVYFLYPVAELFTEDFHGFMIAVVATLHFYGTYLTSLCEEEINFMEMV